MTGVLHYLGGRPRRTAALVAMILLIGVLAGLLAGGMFSGPRGAANAATTPVTPTAAPPVPEAAPLEQGAVVADDSADAMSSAIALGRTRTGDGAVAAFTAYASWLVGSPAAAADPWNAPKVVGGKLLNTADAGSLATMQRGSGDNFDAEHGAYRVLAHSGDAATPDEVMIEVTAPLTLAGKTQWRTIGGVVGWTAQGWQLVSIQPRDVVQPPAGRADVRAFPDVERKRTFAGLGWRTFRPAGQR